MNYIGIYLEKHSIALKEVREVNQLHLNIEKKVKSSVIYAFFIYF